MRTLTPQRLAAERRASRRRQRARERVLTRKVRRMRSLSVGRRKRVPKPGQDDYLPPESIG